MGWWWFHRGSSSRDEKAETANRAARLTLAWNVAAATTVLLPLLLYVVIAPLFFPLDEEEGGAGGGAEGEEGWSWWWWGGGGDNNESGDGNDGEADEDENGGNDGEADDDGDGDDDNAEEEDGDEQRMLWWRQGKEGENRNGGAAMFVYVWSLLIFAVIVWRGNRLLLTNKGHRELFDTLVMFANLSFLCWILLGAVAGYGGDEEAEEQGFLDSFSSVLFLTYIFWIIFAGVFATIIYIQHIRVSKSPLLNKTNDNGSLI